MSISRLNVGFLGIGWYLPPIIRHNDYWPFAQVAIAEQDRNRDPFFLDRTTTGARPPLPLAASEALAPMKGDPFHGANRRYVLPDEAEPSDMEVEATRRALYVAGVKPDEVDAVMVASLVPDRLHPSNAPAIQHKCGLRNAVAICVDAGCASLQPQLITAAALVRSGVYRRILIVMSAALSRTIDYSRPMSATFGDGAAAAIVGDVPEGFGILGHWMRTEGVLREGVVYAPIVDGIPQRDWHRSTGLIRLTSFDDELLKCVGRETEAYCRKACQGAMDAAGVKASEISLFLANQTTGWFGDLCRRAVNIPQDRNFHTFAEVGNIGAAALLYNLAQANTRRRVNDGDMLLLYAQGAGLTYSAVVYRWWRTATWGSDL